jgi:predicted NUDIX family NTP pyrophosphohydrolase
MARRSSGVLLFKRPAPAGELFVLIAHMGGPFWARKDAQAWSIPKGEFDPGEEPLTAAYREFEEELGRPVPEGRVVELGVFGPRSGKRISVFAVEADFDTSTVTSNEFEMEWPKGSGQMKRFPEIDRAEWMRIDEARGRLVRGQVPALDALVERLGLSSNQSAEPQSDGGQARLV